MQLCIGESPTELEAVGWTFWCVDGPVCENDCPAARRLADQALQLLRGEGYAEFRPPELPGPPTSLVQVCVVGAVYVVTFFAPFGTEADPTPRMLSRADVWARKGDTRICGPRSADRTLADGTSSP